jgi:hypothetical protein
MLLTEKQIRRLLADLEFKTVYDEGRIRLQERENGYSSDPETSTIQAALSIMLQASVQAQVKT